jgi:hypothetical protein
MLKPRPTCFSLPMIPAVPIDAGLSPASRWLPRLASCRGALAAGLIAVLLAVPPTASAQFFKDRFGGGGSDSTAITLPADGTCPPADEDSDEGSEGFGFVVRKIEAPKQIILPDVPLFREATLSNPVAGITAPFQSYVRVLRWDEGERRSHLVKIDTARGPKCGWIEREALLPRERTKPIQIKDLPEDVRRRFGKLSDSSTLDAKVLVRNRFDDEDDTMTTGARVYHRFSDPEPYDTLRIFNALSVFDVAEYGGELWYFVGGERDHEDLGTKLQLFGWVRADELIEWSSRISVSPRSGASGLRIYPNIGTAYDGLSWFAETRVQALPKERVVPPYPLLESWHQAGGAALHRIAFPVTACTSDGECISAWESVVTRSESADKVWDAEQIDFLFVIDATESMQPYFKPVTESIRGFLSEIEPYERERLRFSVVVYGDFLDSTGQEFQFARVVPFGSADGDRQMDALLRGDTFFDNVRDVPDAGFAALIKAISKANWRKSAGWKMVIWIGDHPNRGGDLIGNRPAIYTEADVARSIENIGNAVWSAINVRGRYDAAHNELFMAQAGRILELVDGFGLPPKRAYAEGGQSESEADVVRAVRENLSGIHNAAKEVPRIMAMVAASDDLSEKELKMRSVRDTAGAVLARTYVSERLGLSDAAVRHFFSRSQLVREGWVRQNLHDPDWRYWLSVKWDEMDDLVDASELLCETLSDTAPDFNRIQDAMVATLEAVTGDKPHVSGQDDEANIRIYLSKRLHVPVENFSPLLGQSPDAFVRWYVGTPPSDIDNFRIDVCKKSALLRMVLAGRRVDGGVEDIIYDTRLREWSPAEGKARDYEWTWGTEHGIRYYYLPLDYIL